MAVEIYSTDTDSGQISVIRKNSAIDYQTIREIPIGNAPRGSVKFTTDGRGFVSNTSANTISEIDALTHREVARIEVGHGPRGLGILPGERYLLASNSGSNTVSVVDLESRSELVQIAVGRDPRHMAVTKDGGAAYVSIWGSGYISKLDLNGLRDGRPDLVREVARINVGENAHPYSVNIDASGRFLFVANTTAAYVSVIDLTTDAVIKEIAVRQTGGRAIAFSPDNKYALVTIERINAMAVIRMDDFNVTRYIRLGPSPRGIAVDPNDFTVYASVFSRVFDEPDDPAEQVFKANSLTVVALADVDLESPDSPVSYEEIEVGYGPCSVTIFDTERISYEPARFAKEYESLQAPAIA